ncbi:MAG: hypothetical protein FWF79_00815 [Defluviitaleaceae bacterium]|nr:hypothetical protein [Defluviitaleaceae bacterium]
MKGYKIIPPKQRYMNISQMYDLFGSRGIIAYSCKIVDSVLEGGVVIAVQDEGNADNRGIKDYLRQLQKSHFAQHPMYYLRIEKDEAHNRLLLTYDNGGGERKITPKLEVKKSAAEQAISQIPAEYLAQALRIKE